MSERFLLPQVGELRTVHELPLIQLCNGLVARGLDQGCRRLEVRAPRRGAVVAEISAFRGKRKSESFAVPSSLYPRVLRRFKAMARMRRNRPADTRGVIRFAGDRAKPVEIPVRLRPRPDGQADLIMTLPSRDV